MSNPSTEPAARPGGDDAAKAIRFLVIKAAIFILIPAAAAAIAVYFTLK